MAVVERLSVELVDRRHQPVRARKAAPLVGYAAASLRGLGAQRTLVLLNGRRLANTAFSGAAVDINSIPLSAIERVEVLTDGASAIYGTDAIAGVINFILRKDFSGVEALRLLRRLASRAAAGAALQRRRGGWGDLDQRPFQRLRHRSTTTRSTTIARQPARLLARPPTCRTRRAACSTARPATASPATCSCPRCPAATRHDAQPRRFRDARRRSRSRRRPRRPPASAASTTQA